MRTKALVLAAALAACSAVTGLAQTVYSINAVGYVNLTIPAGFSMIANPLNTTNNTLGSLFTSAPFFTSIYKWNGSAFSSSTFVGAWDNPNFTLNPGEGCFIFNPEGAFTNTFVGEVIQSPNATTALTNDIPMGFSIRGSIVPQAGTATELGLTSAMQFFDSVYKYNNASSSYSSHTFVGAWDVEPSFAVGESFWVYAGAAGNWTRIFQVNTP